MPRRPALLAGLAILAATPAAAGPRTDPACAGYGPGFVQASGTATCVRLSGSVEAGFGAARGKSLFGTRTKTEFDARTQTKYGPLRVFIAPRIDGGG